MKDILLIDKPKGITSYDVIRKLKKKYPRGTKIGHAGTLDPNASGLLIIGVGDATKKLAGYIGLDKTYEAEVLLGVQTDSGDITGSVIAEKEVKGLDKEKITSVLTGMISTLRLPVSKFSAKKVGGVPLYKKAHKGHDAPTILQDMTVHSATPNKLADNIAHITFHVGSGTYVRSLAEELGRRLDLPATLKNLRRTQIGEFDVENAEIL